MSKHQNSAIRDQNRRVRSFSRLGLPVALFLLGWVLASCANLGPAGFSEPALRVGVSPDYPPVIFERDGEIVGIEADFAHRLGSDLHRRIEFVEIPFPDLLDALEAGEIDVVMSGLSSTPDRASRVQFIEPYMEIGQLALIRNRDIGRFGRIQTIRRPGTRVGFQRGTTGERYVASSLTRAASFAFDSVEDGLRSLRADRIDYFIHDAPTVWRIAGDIENRDLHGLYRPLTTEQISWAVRQDDPQLATVLNAALAHWKREGFVDPIVQRWIPVRITLR